LHVVLAGGQAGQWPTATLDAFRGSHK
jgi:hypothetical protein